MQRFYIHLGPRVIKAPEYRDYRAVLKAKYIMLFAIETIINMGAAE